MPKDEMKTVSGTVRDVFAHRFVIEAASGAVLADLGPDAGQAVTLKPGDIVDVTGKQKPSELKVERLALNGEAVPLGGSQTSDDPGQALEAVRATGHIVVAEVRPKPKHFEVLATDGSGRHVEHHVRHDGEIRTSKPGDPSDAKWTLLEVPAG